jgi:hypothetical protein
MADKLIFLSHIHEEKALALLVQQALDDEFSGFVEIFVSSDGTSIPAGSNFLTRIEDGLIGCIGAIYLISPISVKRNWINFELGAVWIRKIMSQRAGATEIPTLPVCHSGITPSKLPSPLNNLNAISANQASQLEFAFRSLQSAVGGKGKLKTDFDALAAKVIAFEQQYTLGSNLVKMFSLLDCDRRELIQHCEQQSFSERNIIVDFDFVETANIQKLKELEANELNEYIKVISERAGMRVSQNGPSNGAHVKIEMPVAFILQFKQQLLS